MCGIFGIIDNKYDQGLGERVSRLLCHRGPDDRGMLVFPEGMIVSTRLAIVDLSKRGHQPMESPDGRISLVFNGEIYNYREIREELKGNYRFRTNTDTEVIIAAYQKWQEDCLRRLRGMFAFGLWDKKEQKLFCATDRFSIKQLYYYHNKDAFIFSSEIKPIISSGIGVLPNDKAIYDFLAFGFQDHNEETFFKDIYQLKPAHYLTFKNGKLEIRQYWDIEKNLFEVEEKENELLEQIDNKLKEVLKYHLMGDVPVALSLSSGLDSSLMRGLVAGLIPSSEKLKCFNFAFVDTIYDESKRLASLKNEECELFVTPVRPDNFFQNYSKLIEIVEEPISGLGTYGYWLNSQTVHDKNIKVLLDGQGGDEIFGGYKYYYYHRFKELYEKRLFEELRKEIEAFNRINQDNIRFPHSNFEDFLKEHTSFKSMKATDGTPLASDYMSKDFKEKFSQRWIGPKEKFKDSFRNAAYNDLLSFKIPKLLRFQDKAAMAHSVEVRVPFLDHTLVELLFSVPSHFLMRDGINKYLVKKLSRRYFVEDIMGGPKLYVSTPQREWIRKDLREEIISMMDNSVLQKEGYIDPEKLKMEYKKYINQKELGNSFFVWKFFSLELWYRNFIKKPWIWQ
jgi:asparagine synthase (glutamine-hydrolysing)